MGRALGHINGTGFVAAARRFIGVPYVWGGESPAGFDCSGLVEYTLAHMGITGVPRTSEAQWQWVQRVGQSQLQPGDLIFETWPGEASPGHVAIYAGGNRIIEAPAPGQNVHEVPWSPGSVTASGGTVVGYGRVPGMSYDGGPPVPVTPGPGAQPSSSSDDGLPAGCPLTLVALPAFLVLALIRRRPRRRHVPPRAGPSAWLSGPR